MCAIFNDHEIGRRRSAVKHGLMKWKHLVLILLRKRSTRILGDANKPSKTKIISQTSHPIFWYLVYHYREQAVLMSTNADATQ
jgi:hypothetical protein